MDFRVPHGPFEPPLEDRIRIDQSQGYEPCGLNLAKPPVPAICSTGVECLPHPATPGASAGVLFFFTLGETTAPLGVRWGSELLFDIPTYKELLIFGHTGVLITEYTSTRTRREGIARTGV